MASTIVCGVEALRAGSVPIQLMGLWTAAAAQIGGHELDNGFILVVCE